MSAPGKREEGFILLDVLIALLLLTVGFGSIFMALNNASKASLRFEETVLLHVERRNEAVRQFP